MDIEYQITFFSEWHCGSGLSAGFGADLAVIRDGDGLPFIPGKTVKGLLRNAAQNLAELDQQNKESWNDFIHTIFGRGGDTSAAHFIPSDCFFSDAELPENIRHHLLSNPQQKRSLYREISSTAIDHNGLAQEHSLRVLETVVPLPMKARVAGFPDNIGQKNKLESCMKWIKRLGVHRNRGLGRCTFEIMVNGEGAI